MPSRSPTPKPLSWAIRMYGISIGSNPMILADIASTATESPLARITFWTLGTIVLGPAPSPQTVPSMTENIPGWSSLCMMSRSTKTSWMYLWAKWRTSFSSPPKAFLTAPVVTEWPWVLTVGRWMMFFPMNILGISIPLGKIWFSLSRFSLNSYLTHSTSGRGTYSSPRSVMIGAHLLFFAPFVGLVTTVLFSTGMSFCRSYPSCKSPRTTPSSCQGWLEQEGKYLVQDRFSFINVSSPLEI